MISVIIPAFNAQDTIARCLESLLQVKEKEMEILVVDDGSTDLTAATVRRFAATDSRVCLISKPNGGVSSARNAGLNAAKGDWITFVDADDSVDPEMFAKAISSPSGDADLIIGSLFIGDEQVPLRSAEIDTPEFKIAFLNRYITSILVKMVWNKLYRRSLIDSMRFDSRIRFGEDTLFSLTAIAGASKILLTDTPWYRYTPPADTSKYTGMDIADSIHSAKRLLEAYNASGADVPEFETRVFLDYRRRCQSRIYSEPRKWYADPFVRRYYRRIRSRLPLLYRAVYAVNSLPPVYSLRALLHKQK